LPIEELRKHSEGGAGFDRALWEEFTALGLPGLLVPESHGGAGLGVLDAAVVAEQMGYAAAPAPFIAVAVMAPVALRASGNALQQAAWLPRIANGQARIAVASGLLAGQTGKVEVCIAGDRLSGEVDGVFDLAGATHVLVYAADGRAALAALDAEGITARMRPSLDRTRPFGELTFAGARAEVLEAPGDAVAAAMRVIDAGRVMLAADTLGAAQCMLDKAVAWAGERVQFGRVIGSFQAVKHVCADMATALEPCHALVWYAAHAQDAIAEEARIAAAHAKAHLAEVGRDVARLATEVHGGMGFTDLLGLHLWFKRIAFDRHLLGGPERCRHDAAVAQGWITG
jgi:alkylation response protein AidB-like acyl-CoA dehydrogenase